MTSATSFVHGRFNPHAVAAPACVGAAALVFGAIYYAALRPAATAAGLASSDAAGAPVLATVLGALPTFLHVSAFALLTGAVAACGARGRAWLCASWVGIDALFEIGQHVAIGPTLAAQLGQWCGALSACTRTGRFFAQGTFDTADLVAGILGGLAAYALLRDVRRAPGSAR